MLQVYSILLNPVNVHNPTDKASYPHIRTLLDFDTREFLNVIALVGQCFSVTFTKLSIQV